MTCPEGDPAAALADTLPPAMEVPPPAEGDTLASYPLHEISAAGLLLDPWARAAYERALGPLVRESWLAELDGPSPLNRRVMVADTAYLLASACKNHDCYEHNVVLLYQAELGVVFGKVYQDGVSTLIGSPSVTLAVELDRLWREEFRSR